MSPAGRPMFPLQSALLPGEALPLRIFEPRYSALVQDCLAPTTRSFGVVLISRGREVGGGDSAATSARWPTSPSTPTSAWGTYELNRALSANGSG